MMLYDLGAALVVALVAIGWLLVRYTAYRARFKFTDADIKASRKDNSSRSRSVLSGQVQEQLAPFLPELLAQFNPCDVRHVGPPLDLIVFD
jgi:predicted Holliday junction resolvase-like endonuclease